MSETNQSPSQEKETPTTASVGSASQQPIAPVIERYQQIIKEQQAIAEERKQQAQTMPWVRGGLFLALVVLLSLGLSGELFAGWYLLELVVFVAFMYSVSHHRRLRKERQDAELLAAVCQRGLDRLEDRWQRFPHRGDAYQDDDHPYAQDLDIFGQGSLFQYLHTMQTHFGEETLAHWICEPADTSTIQARQKTVLDLKEHPQMRRSIEREGMRLHLNEDAQPTELPNPEPFLQWVEGGSYLKDKPFLKLWIWISPAFVVTTFLIQQITGKISMAWWALPLLAQLLVAYGLGGHVVSILSSVSLREKVFLLYANLFRIVDQETAEKGTPLHKLQSVLREQGHAPHEEMARLQKIIDMSDVRYSGLIHFPLNTIFFWDLHCLTRLETWQDRVGPKVRSWFELLGELEALCALATFADENPDYRMPSFTEEDAPLCFEAKELGHPLLSRRARVANDLSFNEVTPLLLLTGSNMSGKSTLLRTIGLNTALAYTGAPVCAESFELSPNLQIATSMRIKDSLEHGISFFMAELYRLKRVLDLRNQSKPLFYLLDEMLHGTNTLERRVAALGIISQLLDSKAIGSVSTHDMELSEKCKRFGEKVEFAYLSDQIKDRQMRFDYKLRKGISPTTNALKLMEIVGIELPEGSKEW
ncbi:MAG: hypothetical protein H6728_16925 [Myxococcales bacterium]|nr:hypothetical protein [Myxococcales bacterium]MCB9644757.1 hypothetical protein [Myxococcales bacterium]